MLKKSKIIALLLSTVIVSSVSLATTGIPAFAAGSSQLISMHELDSDNIYVKDDGITDSYGKTYSSNVLEFNTGNESFVTYDLNGAYERFSGSIVASTRTNSNANMDVGIYADGVKIYDLKGFTRQKPAEPFDLDVKGVGELSIKTTKTDGYDAYIYFVDSNFTKADSATTYPNRDSLSDLVIIDSGSSGTYNRLFVDPFGNVHNGKTEFNTGNEGFVLYNLDKKYTSFSGTIVAGTRTNSNSVMNIEFLVDNNPVYSKEGITRDTPQIDFELDVANASTLKIVTSKSNGYDCYLYVTDSILKAHEHTPGEWEIEKDATCTEVGKKVQKCADCGETIKEETISATGHKPESKWTITKEPTCTEQGEQIKKCTVCGDPAETEKIEPTGHSPSGKWEYLEEGKCKKVQFCTVCGDVALEQKDTEIEHTPSGEWVITKEATCNHEGEQIQYCKICGEPTNKEVIPTTDHDYGKWETISGSIWNNPIVKERTCSICGDVERSESSPTSWLKPLIVVLLIIIIGGFAVILVTLKMNGLPLELASIKKLFSKEALSDTDIEKLINKPDNKNRKN